MRRLLPLLAALSLVGTLPAQPIVELEAMVTGLASPVAVSNCGDQRLFIVERAGLIKVLPLGAVAPLATPFLDITGPVNNQGGEQGLLGLAFHPDYAQNGYFFVYYCSGTGTGAVRVSRFSVTADPNVADPASEVVLWELAQPFFNHKGGDLHFGPDGYLYFAPGDGGDAGDPGNRAQNMALGYGKIHRIDVNGALPYTIPPTNPFANATEPDTLRTIFASGLRNPFRFSFDRLNGDLWIGDVGQNTREEVDRIPAGQITGPNFGWRCYEGTAAYNTAGCGQAGDYVTPVIEHDHANGWCSVIGGRVYRGIRYPNLVGRYIYSDYCHGKIHSLRPNGQGGWIFDTLMTVNTPAGVASFGEDFLGELYTVNTNNGTLYRLLDVSSTVRLAPKLVLEGPFNSATGLMNDGLRVAGLLPLTEPYTTQLGFPRVAKGGGETIAASILNTAGNNAVVDWVRLELRPALNPTVIAASRQALLQRDGDIFALDNATPLTFRVGPGSYWVVIRHRNHLACMTAAPIALNTTIQTLDFRSSATATFGTNARKTIGTTQALWAGNAVLDGSVKYVGVSNDRDAILNAVGGTTPNGVINGYRLEDVNMDGAVRYVGSGNDRDPILVNIGGSTPNAVLFQQLP